MMNRFSILFSISSLSFFLILLSFILCIQFTNGQDDSNHTNCVESPTYHVVNSTTWLSTNPLLLNPRSELYGPGFIPNYDLIPFNNMELIGGNMRNYCIQYYILYFHSYF